VREGRTSLIEDLTPLQVNDGQVRLQSGEILWLNSGQEPVVLMSG
jgi:hypothetical protein